METKFEKALNQNRVEHVCLCDPGKRHFAKTEYLDQLTRRITCPKCGHTELQIFSAEWKIARFAVVLIDNEFGELETTDTYLSFDKDIAEREADRRNRRDPELEEGQTWQVRDV